jgi:hypothetical protein
MSIPLFTVSANFPRERALMTDQQVALQAMSDAQHILEEFLRSRPHK